MAKHYQLALAFCIVVLVGGATVYFLREHVPPGHVMSPFNNVWHQTGKRDLLELLNKAQKVTTAHNINMVAMFGTLLGVRRHRGVIPWDDDMDFAIPIASKEDFHRLEDEFREEGVGLTRFSSEMFKIYLLRNDNIRTLPWSWPFIDIFFYDPGRDKVVIAEHGSYGCYDKSQELHDQGDRFDKDDFFPLRTGLLEGVLVNIPNKSDKILTKLYGDDWKDMCHSSSWNHRRELPEVSVHKKKCADVSLIPNVDNVEVIGRYNADPSEIIPMKIEYEGFQIQKPLDGKRLTTLADEPDFLTAQGIRTFLINMDVSKERLTRMLKRLKKARMTNVTRMQGFNGKNEHENMERELPEFAVQPSLGAIKQKKNRLEAIGYTSQYGNGQQGCACSHIYVWKYIVQNKIPIALILEDDIFFHPDFPELFTKAWSNRPKDGTLFNLQHTYAEISNFCADQEWVLYAGESACCYLLTYEGAEQLLEKFSSKIFPDIIPINDDVPFSTHGTSYKLHYINDGQFNKGSGGRECGLVSSPVTNAPMSSVIYQINRHQDAGIRLWMVAGLLGLL